VSKIQLFLLSLVGAGPAGFLTYLLCMYLIDQPSGANSMVMVFAIITVLCTAPLTLLPVLILAMYYSNYDPPKIPKASKKAKDEDDAGDDVTDDDATDDLGDDVVEDLDAGDDLIDDDEFEEVSAKKSKGKKKKKKDDDDTETLDLEDE